jgi:hypothetical protein
MKPVVISNFYNEEYMLPWWLMHHKDKFEHGIMIDYDSTDNSASIIKEICPTWDVVKSSIKFFDAELMEFMHQEVESKFDGWRIFLNTTEFLFGDLSIIESYNETVPVKNIQPSIAGIQDVEFGFGIPVMTMVDNEPNNLPIYDKPLYEQKYNGIHFNEGSYLIRKGRLLHNKRGHKYPTGRHYNYTTTDLMILWYGYSPYNKLLKQRKLQIKDKIPESDKIKGFGTEHFYDDYKLDTLYVDYLNMSRSLIEDIRSYSF